MHVKGRQADVDDAMTRARWAYAAGLSELRVGTSASQGKRARGTARPKDVCWFCRNYEHHLCSGFYDLGLRYRCVCGETGHPPSAAATRVQL